MGNVDTKLTFRKAIVQLGNKNQVYEWSSVNAIVDTITKVIDFLIAHLIHEIIIAKQQLLNYDMDLVLSKNMWNNENWLWHPIKCAYCVVDG